MSPLSGDDDSGEGSYNPFGTILGDLSSVNATPASSLAPNEKVVPFSDSIQSVLNYGLNKFGTVNTGNEIVDNAVNYVPVNPFAWGRYGSAMIDRVNEMWANPDLALRVTAAAVAEIAFDPLGGTASDFIFGVHKISQANAARGSIRQSIESIQTVS